MSGTIVAAMLMFFVVFVWTLTNVVVAIVLWLSHQLVLNDRKILAYLLLYWACILGGLILLVVAVQESGLLKEWLS